MIICRLHFIFQAWKSPRNEYNNIKAFPRRECFNIIISFRWNFTAPKELTGGRICDGFSYIYWNSAGHRRKNGTARRSRAFGRISDWGVKLMPLESWTRPGQESGLWRDAKFYREIRNVEIPARSGAAAAPVNILMSLNIHKAPA